MPGYRGSRGAQRPLRGAGGRRDRGHAGHGGGWSPVRGVAAAGTAPTGAADQSERGAGQAMGGAAPPVPAALPVAPSHRANPAIGSRPGAPQHTESRPAAQPLVSLQVPYLCDDSQRCQGSTWNGSRGCSWHGRSGMMPPASPARTSLCVTSRQLCLRQEPPPATSPRPAPRPACREQNIRPSQHPEPAGILPPALPLRCSTVLHLLPTLTPEHGACLRDLGTAAAHSSLSCCQDVKKLATKK